MVNNNSIYIVSTPIGNLKDITLRALEVLNQVDFIICEDTRTTVNLIRHYEISKPLISLNAVNEERKADSIIEKIKNGSSCALVSDSGTPTISDPGSRLISLAIQEGIKVVPVPGASALIAALSISGTPSNEFLFVGFLPNKKGRQKKLSELQKINYTIVFYESVHRIEKLIGELCEFFPNRYVHVFRELTKMFEEVWRGKPYELKSQLAEKKIKGEFVVIISPANNSSILHSSLE
jgi:16S rRNA (cytidine1402-2'-O)-methyltransferase